MKDRQFHIYLDDEEFRQVLQALIALKNNLICLQGAGALQQVFA